MFIKKLLLKYIKKTILLQTVAKPTWHQNLENGKKYLRNKSGEASE